MLGPMFARIREFLSVSSNALSRRVRVVQTRLSRSFRRPTHDWTRPDYNFWRLAYYGRAQGLELSGTFLKPLIGKVSSWTLGRPPQWKLENETSAEELGVWWDDNHFDILRAYRASIRQGDEFLVVNPDLTVTLVPPEVVDPIVDDSDFSNPVGWRVTQTYTHPDNIANKMTVVDEYTAERRTHIVEVNGAEVERTEFPNLIGRLPIIHIANNRDDGETFGHPEAEALVELLHRYGLVLEAAIEGNELQGRPTPVLEFESVADMDRFWEIYGQKETQTLPDGTTEQTIYLAVDMKQILTVSGAKFSYQSPGSFTGDTQTLLELMFYLILEHTELPEFVFGNAIASSKASAETQMPVFIRFIEGKQTEAAGWLTQLAEIALAYKALMVPGVAFETPTLQWEPLSQQEGQLTLDTVRWAYAEGLLDDKTALILAPVDIEDIDAVLEQAQQEREERFPEELAPGEDEELAIFKNEVNRLEAENEA